MGFLGLVFDLCLVFVMCDWLFDFIFFVGCYYEVVRVGLLGVG